MHICISPHCWKDAFFSQEDNKAILQKFVRSKYPFKQLQFTAKTMQLKKKKEYNLFTR